MKKITVGTRVQIHQPKELLGLREGYAHGQTGVVVSGTRGYLKVKMDGGPTLSAHDSVLRATDEIKQWDDDAVAAHDAAQRAIALNALAR